MRISASPVAGQGSPGMPWGWRPGPRVWQHLHRVGTELVHLSPAPSPIANGSAVIAAGDQSYSVQYRVRLDPMWMVTFLTVTVTVAGASRSVRLHRGAHEQWRVSHDGVATAMPAVPAGRPDRPDLVWLTGSPLFVGWAVRALGLHPEHPAVLAPVIHIDAPSLVVRRSVCGFQLIAPGRLQVSGNGEAFTCYLNGEGVVAIRPGRARLVATR